MAKGRKHGASDRHERLLGTYGYADGHGSSMGNLDLAEDDVWLTSPSSDHGPGQFWTGPEPNQTNSNRSSRAGHWTANDHRHVGGLSLAFESSGGYGTGPAVIHEYRSVDSPSARHVVAASAPVNVLVWSKMVRVDSNESINGGSVESDMDESEWVPPHEYLAREHGKSVTTSVFEGVGRTLKGRDMSRVRDAVWSKTGFFG